MKRNISAGLIITCLSAVAALVGVIAYVVNTGTNYYAKMGVDATVLILLIVGAVVELVTIVLGLKGSSIVGDVLPVVGSVLLTVGTVLLVNARVNNLAAVFTFENSAANMADTTSCIVAIAACAAAMLVSILASFFDIPPEDA